ncbi:hypothetical protein N8940_02530, partial [Sphingomonadaceae bacterium]|nr:hypothetical protein [Sphingomonadaceae bacterium]
GQSSGSVDGGNAILRTGTQGGATTASFGAIEVSADGTGFSETDSIGGSALFALLNADVSVAGDLAVNASSFGGAGPGDFGTNAGDGTAGEVTLTADSSSLSVGGATLITADGIGGSASSEEGLSGTGIGGIVALDILNASTLTLGETEISTTGVGGSNVGGSGGDGFGGELTVNITGDGSQLAITDNGLFDADGNDAVLLSDGIGGDGGGGDSPGVAGDGSGGLIDLTVSDGGAFSLPDRVAGENSRFSALALGGDHSEDEQTAGEATGGFVALTVAGAGATADFGNLVIDATGAGGSSANDGLDISGGAGVSGSIAVEANTGGVIAGQITNAFASGIGGNGSGNGNGGAATGGAIDLIADGGDIDLIGLNNLNSNAIAGSGAIGGNAVSGALSTQLVNNGLLTITADEMNDTGLALVSLARGGQGTVTGGDGTSGETSILLTSGSLDGVGTVSAFSFANAGDGATAGETVSGNARIVVAEGSDLTVGLDGAGSSVLLSRSLAVAGETEDSLGNSISGDASLNSGGSIDVAGSVIVQTVAFANLAPSSGEGGNATAGNAILQLSSNAELLTDNLTVRANAATAGSRAASGGDAIIQLFADGAPTIEANSIVIEANATGGAADDNFDFAGSFDIDVGSGSITTNTLDASALGDAAINESFIGATGGPVLISDTANINVAGDLTIETQNGNIVGGPTLVDPTVDFTVVSNGVLTLTGSNNGDAITFGGETIDLTSADIEIEDGMLIGAFDLIFRPLASENAVIIGGDTDEEEYTITQAEASRIEDTGTVTLNAPLGDFGSALDDTSLIIRDLTFQGNEVDGGVGRVNLIADGNIRVEGDVQFVAADTDNLLNIVANRAGVLEIPTPFGSIAITDTDGFLSGQLNLQGRLILVADPDTLPLLEADPTAEAHSDALTDNPGAFNERGYIQANFIALSADEAILIENTG